MLQSGYDERHYQAYLLRFWQERACSPDQPAVWRFSLEDTRDGKRIGFGNLEELTSFLQTQIDQAIEQSDLEETPS